MSSEIYDVAILGSGLGGSILAAILARLGHRVVILERRSRPRPYTAESMPRQASLLLWLLGHRYDVAEILDLTSTERLSDRVAATSGARRSYGFLHHEAGRRPDARQALLVVPESLPFCSESHLFRRDVDQYLIDAARRYGATYREGAAVAALEPGRDGVALRCADGRPVRARFVVDDSGRDSPVAARFGLRREPPPLRTRTRSLYTQVKGLRPFDETLAEGELPGLQRAWFRGTLHHAFDGGTFWAIPFDNHAGSINPLASVGLTLDLARFPHRSAAPEEEWRGIAARFPAVAAHFAGMVPVRPWVATERLQFDSRSCLAERCLLLPGSAAFIDRFYGGDLGATCETLSDLIPRLLAALEADDFAPDRFAEIEERRAARTALADRWTAASLKASAHPETWNAWQRVWLADVAAGEARYLEQAGREGALSPTQPEEGAGIVPLPEPPAVIAGGAASGPLSSLAEPGEALMNGVAQGMIQPSCAARQVLDLLGGAALPPVFPLAAPAGKREGEERSAALRGLEGESWGTGFGFSSPLKTKRPPRFPEAAPS